MQVTQTSAEGLKHEFKVIVPAGQIETKVKTRLTEVGQTASLPGFRRARCRCRCCASVTARR